MAKKYITSEEKALFRRSMGENTQKQQKYREALEASGLFVSNDKTQGPSIETALEQFHRNRRQQAKITPQNSSKPTPYDGVRASRDIPQDVKAEDALFFHRGGVQHRLMSQLKRGQIPVGAEADLHGLTVAEADSRLVQLLSEAHQRGVRCVRIIHGKNHRHVGQKPVLKNYVNQLLQERPDVLAFCSAPISQGGKGAVLVLLRSLDKMLKR